MLAVKNNYLVGTSYIKAGEEVTQKVETKIIKKAESASSGAKKVEGMGNGADDISAFQKYKQSLIADDVLSNSDVIIEGGKLWDDKAIKALTSDGSAIEDWAKMSSKYSYDTPYGRGQYHYYQNIKTKEVHPFDVKLKLNKEPHYVIPMDSNFNPIQ